MTDRVHRPATALPPPCHRRTPEAWSPVHRLTIGGGGHGGHRTVPLYDAKATNSVLTDASAAAIAGLHFPLGPLGVALDLIAAVEERK